MQLSRAGGGRAPRILVANPGADLYGSDRMVLETVTGLVDSGHDVIVTMPSEGPLCRAVEQRGARVIVFDMPVLRKGLQSPGGLLRLAAAGAGALRPGLRLLRQEAPDAVYVSTVTVPLWIALARLRGIPVACHVHEAESTLSRTVKRALAAPLLRADRVFVNSRFTFRVLTETYPSLASRAALVYNGVAQPPGVVPPRTELAGQVRLVYVGRLSHRKGVDVAVAATALLRQRGLDADLTVVGAVFPGNESYEADLRRQVAELGLAERVHFRGFEPQPWDALAAADIALVPARLDESFGNTAVEAVLSARPVVVSRIGGLVEAVADVAAAVTVRPDDAQALADAVSTIAADWGRYRDHAVADSVAAAGRYAPGAYHARIAELVDGLTAEARSYA